MPSRKRRWKQLATDLFSLPPDALEDVSRVTCLNGQQIIVENIRGLLRVSEEQVDIDLGHALLRAVGTSFVVTLASPSEVHLQGNLHSLNYLGKEAYGK